MVNNVFHSEINSDKRESISFIKSIGQQHDFLTSISNVLNACYSIQVQNYFITKRFLNHNNNLKMYLCDENVQVMVFCGTTFMFCVLSVYTFYRNFLQTNEIFKQVSLIHFIWVIFYMALILVVIHNGNRMVYEVFIEK